MPDRFQNFPTNLDSPAVSAFTVTPHATNELPFFTRALWVGQAGDINCVLADDANPVVLRNVPVGLYPLRIKRILVASTTAALMVGLY